MSEFGIRNYFQKLIPLSYRVQFQSMRKKILLNIKKIPIKLFNTNVTHMKKRLERFHNAYLGQRCFIMGNGPSLNKMDLSLFANEYVWASNRAYLLFDRLQWRPKFYVAVDTRVVPDNANEINSLVNKIPEMVFFFPQDFFYNRVLNSEKNVYWYKEIQLSETNLPYSMFSSNPSEFVYSVRSVTIAMLQLAVFLGFNPIYLIGCDTSYVLPETVQFEGGNRDLIISSGADPNHFDSTYFGKGKKWHEPHVDRMIFQYDQAKKVCDEKGVRVMNATIGGNLEVFPRIDYLELF